MHQPKALKPNLKQEICMFKLFLSVKLYLRFFKECRFFLKCSLYLLYFTRYDFVAEFNNVLTVKQ